MAVPHPARPTWPDALRFAHSTLLPHQRLLTLDERLHGAAARPAVVPETIVTDRGTVYLSKAFTAACETLGISVQAAPPYAPTAKGIVERTFGSINALFCQHLPGYTGPDITRRGPAAAHEARYTIPQLQDLLDEWLIHWHHRPHQGLRHPVLPKAALTPNQMWAALIAVAGYVPAPLTGSDYLELLPVRWQAITERGIRLHHRTYDHDLLAPHRGRPSPIAARGGKWEVHHNPHDARQIWVRLSNAALVEIPWIHRDHSHHPFNERTWQHVRAHAVRHPDPDQHEADLADALDQLMRRARDGSATHTEHHLLSRTPKPLPALASPQNRSGRSAEETAVSQAGANPDADSLDDLDDTPDEPFEDEPGDDTSAPAHPYTGLGLYDAHAEALTW
nr:Mu transposase C-terminal domain-containing protein [Streptomyces sp. ISL-43]